MKHKFSKIIVLTALVISSSLFGYSIVLAEGSSAPTLNPNDPTFIPVPALTPIFTPTNPNPNPNPNPNSCSASPALRIATSGFYPKTVRVGDDVHVQCDFGSIFNSISLNFNGASNCIWNGFTKGTTVSNYTCKATQAGTHKVSCEIFHIPISNTNFCPTKMPLVGSLKVVEKVVNPFLYNNLSANVISSITAGITPVVPPVLTNEKLLFSPVASTAQGFGKGGMTLKSFKVATAQVVPKAVRRHLTAVNRFWCAEGGGITPKTSMSVLGPDQDGKYKVPFSIWFGVPEGTTFTGYAIHSNGTREYIDSNTITAETAGYGWAGGLWGHYTGGAPLPKDIIGFRLEFTGAFQTYSVNASVPSLGRVPALVDVYPDGKLFLRVWFCPSPVVSLNGSGRPVVDGWITPMNNTTGPNIPVAVCSGFPDSECLTQVVDIPAPQ